MNPFRQLVISQFAIDELLEAVSDEDSPWVHVSVSVTGDLLEVFDGTEALELTGSDANERARSVIEAFWVRQHVDKQFDDAGVAAVVFGDDEYGAIARQKAVDQFLYGIGLFFVRIGQQGICRQFVHVQQVYVVVPLTVGLGDFRGQQARQSSIAVCPADDDDIHVVLLFTDY